MRNFSSKFHSAFTTVNYETLIKTKMLSSGKIVLTKLQSLLDFHHFSINVLYLFQNSSRILRSISSLYIQSVNFLHVFVLHDLGTFKENWQAILWNVSQYLFVGCFCNWIVNMNLGIISHRWFTLLISSYKQS